MLTVEVVEKSGLTVDLLVAGGLLLIENGNFVNRLPSGADGDTIRPTRLGWPRNTVGTLDQPRPDQPARPDRGGLFRVQGSAWVN